MAHQWVGAVAVAQLALMIDLERCTGCKSCEAACKQANVLGPHTYRNRVMWFSEQNPSETALTPEGALNFLTVTCQQCERPACLRACPIEPKVISRDADTGVVSIDESRCTGCGECVISCPYGAIGYDQDKHHAVKCDLCAGRRAEGEGPACASVCPTKAISFGERSDLLAHAESEGRDRLEHDHFLQKPATIYLKRLTGSRQESETQTGAYKSQSVPAIMSDDRVRANLGAEVTRKIYDKQYRQLAEGKSEQIIPGGCNICFNACPVKYHLRDGEVVNIFGNDEDPLFQGRVCAKSQMTLQLYDNAERLTQPLKRVGERGRGEFEVIGWAQALDEIAAKLRQLKADFGPEALAIQAGSRTGVLNILGTVPLFAELWGTANVASTGAFCDQSKVVALQVTQGSTMMANVYTADDIGSAQLYVYVGDNQAETRPVNFGMLNDWRINNAAKMVVVDPRLTVTASKADHWLAIRPGTDMALGLAMIHHIFEHNLADLKFCRDWILGWEQWRDFIFERGYTPQWASRVTDISQAHIQDLAEEIAGADGCMIFTSRGVNQHTNAAQTNRTFMFLAAITGNWGRRGGGYFNVTSEPDWRSPELPAERVPDKPPAISKNPAAWLDAMLGDDVYPIRGLITGNNPLGQWPDQNKARHAVSQLDLVVHMELFRNDTSTYADYVLPMASGIEKGGPARFAEDRRLVWNDRLIDPPGEAKSDHWFWIELGKRFGFDDVLKEAFKDPRRLWDEVVRPATPTLKGVTIRRLLATRTRWVRLPAATETSNEITTLYLEGSTAFGQPQGKRFPTDSGRLEFWTELLETRFTSMGLSALPEFYSEREQLIDLPYLEHSHQLDTPVVSTFFEDKNYARPASITVKTDFAEKAQYRQEYDTELVTGRPPAPHFHSWTHYFWQAQEMWPELYCQIHPDKAAVLNIAEGDQVKVETTSGFVQARAWLHRGIRESAVFIPIGWDKQQPFHPGASVNHLTGIALDPISQQANLKVHLCKVTKVDNRSKTAG